MSGNKRVIKESENEKAADKQTQEETSTTLEPGPVAKMPPGFRKEFEAFIGMAGNLQPKDPIAEQIKPEHIVQDIRNRKEKAGKPI